jgi:hypothetical protein
LAEPIPLPAVQPDYRFWTSVQPDYRFWTSVQPDYRFWISGCSQTTVFGLKLFFILTPPVKMPRNRLKNIWKIIFAKKICVLNGCVKL